MIGYDPHAWEDFCDDCYDPHALEDFCEDCNELRETGRHVYCSECEAYLKSAEAPREQRRDDHQ